MANFMEVNLVFHCHYILNSHHIPSFFLEGRLIVEGGVYQGTWRHGKLVDGRFIFKDELQYKKIDSITPWEYCSAKDPRLGHFFITLF